MEEMQKQFNLTIAALNATSRQAYERDQEHQRDIKSLEEQLGNVSNILEKLVEERETLAHTVVEQHLLLMVVEVVVLCVVFTICHRRRIADIRQENGALNERRAQVSIIFYGFKRVIGLLRSLHMWHISFVLVLFLVFMRLFLFLVHDISQTDPK